MYDKYQERCVKNGWLSSYYLSCLKRKNGGFKYCTNLINLASERPKLFSFFCSGSPIP